MIAPSRSQGVQQQPVPLFRTVHRGDSPSRPAIVHITHDRPWITLGCEATTLRSERRKPVVRYAKEHKQVTRQRILEKAGHRFKQDGIDGSGVSTLMSDAGLTNGAFYAHFESKDDIFSTAA